MDQRISDEIDDGDSFLFPSQESHLIAYEIGRICIAWSSLDVLLSSFVASYIGSDNQKKSEILGNSIDFRKKIEMGKALSLLVDDGDRFNKIDKIFNFIDNPLRASRNRYVHGLYAFQSGSHQHRQYKTKFTKPQSRTISISTVTETEICVDDLRSTRRALSLCEQCLAGLVILAITGKTNNSGQIYKTAEILFEKDYQKMKIVIDEYSS